MPATIVLKPESPWRLRQQSGLVWFRRGKYVKKILFAENVINEKNKI